MIKFIVGLSLALGGVFYGFQSKADDLPASLELKSDPEIITLDGSNNHVGRISKFDLKLFRQYTPQNALVTPYTLDYFYGNGNKGETQRGSQIYTIDLLDSAGKPVVLNVLGNLYVPRGRCWYHGGSPQHVANTINFDYVNKDITSMRVNVGRVSGTQTPC
jgi:hypothetical protein